MLFETNNYVTIAWRTKSYTTDLLQYMDQMWIANIYTSNIKKNASKKLKFNTMILIVKINIQIVMMEDIISELTRLLTEFILKYHQNTGLNIKEVHYVLQFNNKI